MRRSRFTSAVAMIAGSALVLSACADNGDDAAGDNGGGGDTITLAWPQPFDSYNNTTAGANSFANGVVMEWVTTGFWHFAGEDGQVTPNEEFGSYEKVSDDPLTVEYTINEDATWSDGEPIDCDDALLWWAQQSGESDYSVIGTDGVEDTEVPDCEAGDKEFTLEYDKPFADWNSNGPSNGNTAMMPAHVVAEQGGLSSEEFIEAVKAEDWEALEDTVDFFNEGWLIEGGLPDQELIPSSGPYKLDSYEAGQHVTLTYNEEYWGEAPETETIVIREIPEEEQVQALENQEVDIINPQPTVDIANQIEAAEAAGIESAVENQYSYEHLDFNFNDGPFAESRELREAFALCVPRQTIVENLIQPVLPEAETKDIRNIAPWDPGFEEGIERSSEWLDEYGEQDLERSRQILEEEDAVGTEIRLETLDNERRNNTGTLITEACEEAGFEVDFDASADFFDTKGGLSQGTFDVAMFAWIGSSVLSGWNAIYRSPEECTAEGKGNNMGCYSDEEMDQMLDDILRQSDQDKALSIAADIEEKLWADLATIPLYQHPNIAAWQQDVQNIVMNPTQTGLVWNMPEWSRE
ncbi:ABC transporter family substrate-binding protein [Haloechinothrix sp. YIM 98757]|uniref:ABC transporter family substrate-binding protein n=1 Tax=Haloechinothrix aidingensis TaxID=2752311 RepID=A0A838A9K7_9PSEU|nr:ABC transporter family substrate-binding protein [Haloechinothrix aidingensis]MBA0125392.1 ABC transporter family substrate-binding protein [Haloechinothrix aidingensis]